MPTPTRTPDPRLHRIALTLSQAETSSLRAMLEDHVRPHLSPDVSSYAKGRTRCWLEWEAPLSSRQGYRHGLVVAQLWARIESLWTRAGLAGVPDLGLALHGAVGIRPHRDASYACNMALSVNLGRTSWGWTPERGSNDDADLVWHDFSGGEVLAFDCKHRHAARHVAADRWAVIAWQTKPDPRPRRPRSN